jgi:hypothetical protein
MPTVYAGSKVLTFSNATTSRLFSGDEFKAMCGRSFDNNRDYVNAMCGDWSSNTPFAVIGALYVSSADGIIVQLDKARTGTVRVNYLIALQP